MRPVLERTNAHLNQQPIHTGQILQFPSFALQPGTSIAKHLLRRRRVEFALHSQYEENDGRSVGDVMWKWTKRLILAAVLIGAGFTAYDSYRYGYHTRPEMPDGAFSLSYKSGLRAILLDVQDEKETRRYLGYPMDVPFYLKETWSFCRPPRDDEKAQATEFMGRRDWPGERFEAVCKIEVDNKTVIRGLITSVPKI